jgi:tuberculosinol/isotuberculosinol synthase
MDAGTFHTLPRPEVARLVRAAGPKVCVFPINGTRRWFMLEHAPPSGQAEDQDLLSLAYLDTITERHIAIYRLLFDHGLDTLLTPALGPDLLDRGQAYMHMAAEGLSRLADHPAFQTFYRDYGVRVRFYGDYRRYLDPTPYAHLSDGFDEVTARTLHHDRHRLFFGLFAHDATETVARLGVRHYLQHGRAPDRRAVVEAYYGEYVPPVDLFIGFDKLSAFDMPLLATGNEDLYFTVSPSLYLNESQLRDILYDHLYTRRQAHPDYGAMASADWDFMRAFYQRNLGNTLGLGVRQERGGIWYPLPQVDLPPGSSPSLHQNP